MPMISNSRYSVLTKAEEELDEIRTRQALKPFVDLLLNKVGTWMAHTPFNKWPDPMKEAFVAAARVMPPSAYRYKELLPKK